MKKLTLFFLLALMLTGCAKNDARGYESRFRAETVIALSDTGITVNGGGETEAVFTSRDIVYYQARDFYDSGNPYGEAQDWERHTQAQADAHLVVNITQPGAYRITGTLSAGQIRVDLGAKAKKDSMAVVELVLDNAQITCGVAPAIVFQNVYECDVDASEDNATPKVNTSLAGANLILLGENQVNGSHVAKIFKDNSKGKKLWKQDGAIYSYMSLNLSGSGKLELVSDWEGIGTERHLTVDGGDLYIHARNDGINANEDNLSVITINDGTLRIVAGLGEEGDGIDSNGYLVINGGLVVASAKTESDHGLDSTLDTFLNGGTVVALGEPVEHLSQDSKQAVLDLKFSQKQAGAISVTSEAGEALFSFDPASDPLLTDYNRDYWSALVSHPGFQAGKACLVTVDGVDLGRIAPQ